MNVWIVDSMINEAKQYVCHYPKCMHDVAHYVDNSHFNLR